MLEKQIAELVELCLLALYLLTTWTKETDFSKSILAWWCSVLYVDIFFWHCLNRPPYIKEFMNLFDVGLGLVLIYAKYRNVCKKYLKVVLAFFLVLLK